MLTKVKSKDVKMLSCLGFGNLNVIIYYVMYE